MVRENPTTGSRLSESVEPEPSSRGVAAPPRHHFAGYILGFPTDTPESMAHDIDIIEKELPIDILEFFCLTPLPGSEDHKKLHAAGVISTQT